MCFRCWSRRSSRVAEILVAERYRQNWMGRASCKKRGKWRRREKIEHYTALFA